VPRTSRERLLYAVIFFCIAVPFVTDTLLPLGTAVWVVYLLPVVLAFMAPAPLAPVVVAGLVTVLTFLGFFLAQDGVDPELAITNRAMALLVEWLLAAIGVIFIRNRLRLEGEDWLRTGQVNLARAIAGDLSVQQVADRAIRFLATYLDARAAAIFIKDGGDFARCSSYGLPAEAPVPHKIVPGDGLLAEVAAGADNILLTDVPDNYLYYGSAFGRAMPAQLLIASARADEEINSVLELGFTGSHGKRADEFLTRASGLLGVAIRTALFRGQLQHFLEETQQQAEELQAQSEELQTNNEELEMQSQRLLESQARLEEQQAELEESNAALENQTHELEAQRDELERIQASLEEQAAKLETASRYKSEFLANMSHELRTPLNSLLIMARLLAENRAGNLAPDQVKHARTIESSGNDLLALINDILDISKIEAGKMELDIRAVRPATLIERLHSALAASAATKGLALRTEIAPDTPQDVRTDAQRVEQVLRNFLSNAIKFTEKGEILLSAAPAPDGGLALTVRDQGIGIPEHKLDLIFEAFRQADGSVSRKYGGTGLGLSISRELAGLLGGTIRVESEPGKGSAFTLVIPAQLEPSALATQRPEAKPARRIAHHDPAAPETAFTRSSVEDDRGTLSGSARLILIVEDDPAFATILRDLVRELDFECLVAGTADEGVMLARQYLPSAVVLDMNLPDHTGLSVLDRIKRDRRTRHIPVHIVSVNEDAQAALANGAVGYLLKPVQREQLVDMLGALETRMAQRLRRVLVVEDDARQAESIGLLLASQDVETLAAHSAAECMELLTRHTFDCMVLDLNLPDRSGFDLLEQLSEDETVGFPPVIVYTGRDISSEEELRLRRYSRSIIVKGVKSPERLLDEVTLFLHQVVAELPERQQELVLRSLNRDVALEGKTVLVAEDDIRNVYALTSIFEPHGATVLIARNGQEALDRLDRMASKNAAPDLVLMDVMMPEMDGLSAIRHIRGDERWRRLPIIALTAKAMPRDQQECLDAGANDYLAKPLDVDKLLSLARIWIQQ